jgi:hypothetical protein
MASGSGNSGKIVAGCSCLSMVLFLAIILFIQFGYAALATAVPDVAQYGAAAIGPLGIVSNICCCLSGVGMVVGIAMLLMGGKGEEEF